MRSTLLAALLTSTALLTGCGSTNTLLPVAQPWQATREYVLKLPDNYEIRSVDFEASTDSSGVKGRGFVKVLAVDRRSGEQVLILYENISVRSEPVAIIRFE